VPNCAQESNLRRTKARGVLAAVDPPFLSATSATRSTFNSVADDSRTRTTSITSSSQSSMNKSRPAPQRGRSGVPDTSAHPQVHTAGPAPPLRLLFVARADVALHRAGPAVSHQSDVRQALNPRLTVLPCSARERVLPWRARTSLNMSGFRFPREPRKRNLTFLVA